MRYIILLMGLMAIPAASFASAKTQPPSPGERLFQRDCAACHTIARGSGAAEGPSLYGVIGRKIGSMSGFRYSPALRAKSGKVWTAKLLDQWLTDTQKYAPGANMVYFSENPRERMLLINYMQEQSAAR